MTCFIHQINPNDFCYFIVYYNLKTIVLIGEKITYNSFYLFKLDLSLNF